MDQTDSIVSPEGEKDMDSLPLDTLIEDAVQQAKKWQDRANELMTSEERVIQKQLQRLLENPVDKVVMTQMIDQSFRSKNERRVADQINEIFKRYGVPEFFTSTDKILMRLFLGVGRHFPHVSVPRVMEKMREDSSRSVIPGEPEVLHPYLKKRKSEDVVININHLGEAVMSEDEALARLDTYVADLENPEVEYVSVKISTIYSQISSLAFEHSVAILQERLTRMFRAARDNQFTRRDGTRVPKFINLDMEEYRDLEITAAAFIRTLDAEEFKTVKAGIVLQAYLPDSFAMQKELTAWAKTRVAGGGSPIKIRIVKGANMEMEQIDAALHNWALAPYDNKLDVDANYKRMVTFGMQPDNCRVAHLGIASHNLFELAFAYRVARHYDVTQFLSFEMLEGMADHVRRALQETDEEMILYAPVATRDQFLSAIAYLIRRLDENTSPDNFLRHACHLTTGSGAWEFLENQFRAACRYQDRIGSRPHRVQDRDREVLEEAAGTFHTGEFDIEPDTDTALVANRRWVDAICEKWKRSSSDTPFEIPLVVAGREIFGDRNTRRHLDLNQISGTGEQQVCVAVSALAEAADIDTAVAVAKADPDGWRQKRVEERHEILSHVAREIRRARGDLIGAAMSACGKVFSEADPEVSEAIDFAEYYPFSARALAEPDNVHCRGKGVGAVVSPWNFPIAIPCGGISAALAAGNTVIFKPASAAVVPAWELCQAFWAAGISKNVLQFVPGSGAVAGRQLARHPDIDFVIFTGGTETGMQMLHERPDSLLAGETGGKNATIVTAMSDREQAIHNVLQSAFGHCGQKCSATSLLILEKEVYDDEHFKHQLVTAAKSITIGSAWEFQNRLGPMIAPPSGDLENGLTHLDKGETWALAPHPVDDNPHIWSPGIKYGVKPGSYSHKTEFFGPVLSVMRAENLDEAIDMVNRTGYGLTSGIESLDIREQEHWKEKIEAGNLYINRGTTGAIVLRQPFGGMKKSALGAGIKAGGPNYVAQFMDISDTEPPAVGAVEDEHRLLRVVQEWRQKLRWGQMSDHRKDLGKTIRAVKSYLYNAGREFLKEKDYFHLRGQDNVLRYQPIGTIVVRIHPDDTLFEALARIAAVIVAGSQPVISVPPDLKNNVTRFLSGRNGKRFRGGIRITRQSDDELIAMLPKIRRIRYAAPDRVPPAVYAAAAQTGFYIARAPVLMDGRLELIWYFREQSICNNYHRYGNLGERALD
jgi:RHH-type transcriptional regulator, proline utilization regulon repressor / proline dehydrogenase / delta 1-pyrroline-5-carboxylate dehydrogenase